VFREKKRGKKRKRSPFLLYNEGGKEKKGGERKKKENRLLSYLWDQVIDSHSHTSPSGVDFLSRSIGGKREGEKSVLDSSKGGFLLKYYDTKEKTQNEGGNSIPW